MMRATAEERRKIGQARRQQIPRSEHNLLRAKDRKPTALELLERANHGRIPRLLSRKRELMAASPFGFFRGAAPVMAADLALLPSTGIEAQLCGDAHVRNLGAHAAPDGRLLFDINDFDETVRASFEWDLKRMAASLILAAREASHDEPSARAAAEACITTYVERMHEFAQMPLLEVARHQVHRIAEVTAAHDALLKAERATPQHTLDQLTELWAEGLRRFKTIEPALTRLSPSQAEPVLDSLNLYRESIAPERRHLLSFYRPIDVAFKVVGTGSVGLRDYCIYLEGNDVADPLFLQIKEEPASAWAPYLPTPPAHTHQGRRVVEGQHAIEPLSDPFLGWTSIAGRDYLVRQLNDHKGSIEIADLAGAGLEAYARLCGELLARAHARSGDSLILSGYLGEGDNFAEAVASFGVKYADQTERDWESLVHAQRSRSLRSRTRTVANRTAKL